jgi:hypothetical protein
MSAAIVMVALLLADLESRPPEPPVRDVTTEDFAQAPAHKIAMLDARKCIAPHDLRVLEARDLLDRVDRLYADNAARIVEATELFWREIRSKKFEATATEILKGSLEWREPADFKGGKCEFAEYVVLYATLREEGLSHEKSITFLKKSARRQPKSRD